MIKLLECVLVTSLVATTGYFGYQVIPHDFGFKPLTEAEKHQLVDTCRFQGWPNVKDPPCLIRQKDGGIYGLSIITNGTEGVEGEVISYSYHGKSNFTVTIQNYLDYPHGEHIFPDDPKWGKLQEVYQAGGELADNVTE